MKQTLNRGSTKTNIFFGRKKSNKINTWKKLPIEREKSWNNNRNENYRSTFTNDILKFQKYVIIPNNFETYMKWSILRKNTFTLLSTRWMRYCNKAIT